jgi:hypothetical protein
MNINGETIASLQESKTQNIDLATTIPLVTNFNGAVEINGIPVEAGSTPQPWPGDFDVLGNVNATQFKPLGGLTTMFLKGDGSLDLNTYLTSASLATLETKTQNQSATVNTTTFAGDLVGSNLKKLGGTSSQYLIADGSVLEQSAVSGNSNFYFYDSKSSNIPSTSGQVRYNNSVQSLATIVTIASQTDDDIDIEVFFSQITQLNDLYIQDRDDSSNFIKYNISSSPTIIPNAYISIPVSVSESGGTGTTSFGASKSVLVSFFTNGLEIDTRISTLETKIQNITSTAGATSNVGSFTSGSLAVSNGTSSTLITTTSGTASLPLILPAIQATTGQILQGSSTGLTTWITASSAITDTTQRWISSAIGNDTTGTGTSSAPWATIAKGFTTSAQYPLKLNIRGSFSISTLVLTASNSNTQITTTDGYEALQSTLTGTIQTSGTMTRLKCSGFTFSAPTTSCLIFDDTQGRHVFDNCSFNSASAFPIFVGSTFANWLNFNNCDFTGLTGGTLTLDNVVACTIRLYNCGIVPITIGSGWTVYISGSTTLVSPSAILGTVIQLPAQQFNGVITTQASFNAISVDGLYINQVVGLTGLTGATFGCSFIRVGAVKLISLGFNSLPPTINVLNVSTYNTWVKDPTVSGGWIALNPALYLPLTGGTVSGTLTLGSLGIAMAVSGSINGSLIPSSGTRILGQVGNAWNVAEINTVNNTTHNLRNGANSTTLTTAAASAAIPFVLPSQIGSASQFLTTNGLGQSSWASVAGGGAPLKGVRFFNVAGVTIYTPTAGTTRALVICQAGGGGGGGAVSTQNNSYGAGGNAGGQAIGYYVIDETKAGSFTLGLGGLGVSAGPGGGGTNTTFLYPSSGTPNATITASGAFGGGIKQGTQDDRMAVANINVVSGIIPTLNAVLLSGYTIGGPRGGYGFSTAGDTAISGVGADSAFGVGGAEIYVNGVNTTTVGNAGNGNGSGGGGGISTAGLSIAGGAGRLGCVLIYEY